MMKRFVESIDLTARSAHVQVPLKQETKKRPHNQQEQDENQTLDMEIDTAMPPPKRRLLPDHFKKPEEQTKFRQEETAAYQDLENFIIKPSGMTLAQSKIEKSRMTKQEREEKQASSYYEEVPTSDKRPSFIATKRKEESFKFWNPTTFKKPSSGVVQIQYEYFSEHDARQLTRSYLMKASEITEALWEIMTNLHEQDFEETWFQSVGELFNPKCPELYIRTERMKKFHQVVMSAWRSGKMDKHGESFKMVAPAIKTVLKSSISRQIPKKCRVDMSHVTARIVIKEPRGLVVQMIDDGMQRMGCLADFPNAFWEEQAKMLQGQRPELFHAKRTS